MVILKKLYWPLLALFSLAAAFLRVQHLRTGFDELNLPVRGNPYAVALPLVLLAAAAAFLLLARSLPAQRDETRTMFRCFCFDSTLSVMLAVLAAFALAGYAVLSVLTQRTLPMMLLGIGYFFSAGAMLYTVFQLRREAEPLGSVLILPVCTLVLHLIFTYRSCANDPSIGHTFVAILTVCFLMLTILELSAFAFRNGAPRIFVPLASLSVVLCTCRFVESAALPVRIFCAAFIVLLLAFCSAADFERAEA